MSFLVCEIHKVNLECMGGCSAHRSNWYCPECDSEKEKLNSSDKAQGVKA